MHHFLDLIDDMRGQFVRRRAPMTVSRRLLLKTATFASLIGALPSSLRAAARRPAKLYEELGIRPVVNFVGTHTTIGASKMWEDLHESAAQASREYVVLEELQDKIGDRLSALIGSEDALVTTGAAGAICLGTCAVLTGTDAQKIRRLPDLTDMKSEVNRNRPSSVRSPIGRR
jgi:hypothetical protein